jgi:hypothetical protein
MFLVKKIAGHKNITLKNIKLGWRCCSMVKHLLSICEGLGSILSNTKKKMLKFYYKSETCCWLKNVKSREEYNVKEDGSSFPILYSSPWAPGLQ